MTAGSLHRSRHCVQVESSCIENTKLKRIEEKKPKERKLRRRRRNSHCANASARSASETRPKTGHVTSVPASAVTITYINKSR